MTSGYPTDATENRSSFRPVTFPAGYIRHYGHTAYIAGNGGANSWGTTNLWAGDTGWLVSQPWS
jgi:hypothetical protein